jgi:hypothetical protein
LASRRLPVGSNQTASFMAAIVLRRPAPCINQHAALPPCFVTQPPLPLLASHFLIRIAEACCDFQM